MTKSSLSARGMPPSVEGVVGVVVQRVPLSPGLSFGSPRMDLSKATDMNISQNHSSWSGMSIRE